MTTAATPLSLWCRLAGGTGWGGGAAEHCGNEVGSAYGWGGGEAGGSLREREGGVSGVSGGGEAAVRGPGEGTAGVQPPSVSLSPACPALCARPAQAHYQHPHGVSCLPASHAGGRTRPSSRDAAAGPQPGCTGRPTPPQC
ncbi:hypothetical protein HaLaN_05269 [Haematococcus lacustris]|uniref:Uncharacterized protein n=1 Tax=Haematococcus lacustris TaxID=44745 RepID=A0A699YSW7_HAELA|nr:hypothetical protein HaLaN_05269 [Haematococcus lacustris]